MKKAGVLHTLKKWGQKLFFCLVLFFVSLCLFEWVYRYQFIDFYSSELEALNTKETLQKERTVLVMGDSFSAHPLGYVKHLKDSLPQYGVVNAAIPGTGIVEASLIAPGRITDYTPEVFIYQMYVGNDLIDISKPTNWGEVGFLRNCYWALSDQFRSLSFLNYRMGQFSANVGDDVADVSPTLTDTFNIDRYAQRTKLYIKAEGQVYENSAFLVNGRREDFEVLLKRLDAMLEHLPDSCKVLIPVIPHCAQVNDYYYQHYVEMRAIFSAPGIYRTTNYPMVKELAEHYSDRPQVEIINTLVALRAADREGQRQYYANDPHLNANGNATIGRLLLQRITR